MAERSQLSQLSDADLSALRARDLSKVSNEGLAILKGTSANPQDGFGKQVLSSTFKGLMMGGPLGASMALGDTLLNKGAYEAGGKVTDIAAEAGASPELAAKLGFATNVGIQSIPAIAGGKIASMAAPAFEAGAERLMRSALKSPLSDLKTGRAASAIQTLLDQGINVTPGGVTKLRSKINDLNKEIAQAISQSPAQIDKNAVWKPIKETLNKFQMQVNPNSDLSKIRSAWNEFVNHPLISGDMIPVQTAQSMKQGTYRMLQGKYGELGSAETEAQKALARGLKDEVAAAVPQIAGLNAEESKLLNALSLTERRVLISANKNPIGLAALVHNPSAFAAFLADRSELFKSLLARMLHSGKERIPQAIGATTVAGAELVRDQIRDRSTEGPQ